MSQGDRPGSAAVCRLQLQLRPKLSISDTLNKIDLNRIMVEVDGTTHSLKWGKASLEIPPGQHRISIWVKNLLLTSPKAMADFILQPGDAAHIIYTGPTTMFSAGKIEVEVEAPYTPPPASSPSRVCGVCGQPMPLDGAFCPFCGHAEPAKPVCPKCGRAQGKGKFCVFCGMSLGS
jgi:hypothetical protein